MANQDERSCLDENLDEQEKHGQTRVPAPEEEGLDGEDEEQEPMNPDQPDEFGDGDRRS